MSLKDLLKNRNISQKELAIRTGVTEATISRYIYKTRKMSLKSACKIAIALDISLDELAEIIENKESK